MKKICTFIAIICVALLFVSCSSEKIADEKSNSSSVKTQTTNPSNSTDPVGQSVKPVVLPSSTSTPKEADWTLQVDDTVKIDIEGISIIYTLSINCVKHGGTTDIGHYTGTATLKQKMDVGKLSSELVKITGGVETELKAENVQIDIVAYEKEKYDNFGLEEDQGPLSQLIAPDRMALGAFTMSGTGAFDVSAVAPNAQGQLAFDESGTNALDYKISVEGGQVTVSIPMLNAKDRFKGMITGVPRN